MRIDHNSLLGGLHGTLPGQATFNEGQVSIPIHEALSDDDVEGIARVVRTGR
jgi:hypothetical protein